MNNFIYGAILAIVIVLALLVVVAMLFEEGLLAILLRIGDFEAYDKVYKAVPVLAFCAVITGLMLIVTLMAGAFIL